MTETTKTRIMRICFFILTVLVLLRLIFDIPESLWGLHLLSPPITGLATYLGIIGFNIHRRPFFLKLRLVPLFVAFGFTAPLVELPEVIESISTISQSGAGKFGLSGQVIAWLTFAGQSLWLLIPVQIMISLSGKKPLYEAIGYCAFFTGAFGMFSYWPLSFTLGSILEYILGS